MLASRLTAPLLNQTPWTPGLLPVDVAANSEDRPGHTALQDEKGNWGMAYRIRLVGCGGIAGTWISAVAPRDECEIAMTFDPDTAAAKQRAEETGGRAAGALEDILGSPDIDLVMSSVLSDSCMVRIGRRSCSRTRCRSHPCAGRRSIRASCVMSNPATSSMRAIRPTSLGLLPRRMMRLACGQTPTSLCPPVRLGPVHLGPVRLARSPFRGLPEQEL